MKTHPAKHDDSGDCATRASGKSFQISVSQLFEDHAICPVL